MDSAILAPSQSREQDSPLSDLFVRGIMWQGTAGIVLRLGCGRCTASSLAVDLQEDIPPLGVLARKKSASQKQPCWRYYVE